MVLSTEMQSLREKIGDRKTIELFAKVGFDALDYTFTPGLELGDSPWNRDDYAEYAKEINKIAQDNGIYFNQAHGPFLFHTSYLPDYEREILPLNIRCMECCALLGIPQMVVHPMHHLFYIENRKQLWDMNMEYYQMLLPYAKEFGVKIALENMYRHDERRGLLGVDIFAQPEEFNAFFDELNDPQFICCLDIGHCTLTDQDPAEMIRTMGNRITALHVNDNLYRTDDHLVPGMGLIEWEPVMKALADIHYTGDMTFEALNPFRAFDESFLETAARYMHDVGRYLIRKFEEYSELNGD